MPYNNRESRNSRNSDRYDRDDRSSRSSSSNRDSGRRGGGNRKDARAKRFGSDNFNMLDFGKVFMDETQGQRYDFKLRLLFKTKDGEQVNVFDGDGKGDNEYTPEEAVQLVAKALLEGRAINVCLFEGDDYGSWTGNARIDIKDIESETQEEEPKQRKKSTKAASSTKQKQQRQVKYEVPEAEDEEEFTEDDTEDNLDDTEEDNDLPY